MSLRDARSKMSKSDPSDQTRIALDDPPDAVRQKLRRAKTDAHAHLSYEPDTRPEVANLLELYAGLLGPHVAASSIPARVGEKTTLAAFKADLADLAIATLDPIRRRLTELRADPAYVTSVLAAGTEHARTRARAKLAEVYTAVGLREPTPSG
jgi:tryptophanyl-tRNA synthetase